ncbi:MAG: (deoxy)nucleoside triphosphate pyrophosphohydrolase [Terriglobales bacterium]
MKQVVAALIKRNHKVLICQRTKYQPMPLKWEFPGGKIETGEQARDALRRELDEELGIDATVGDEVARLKHRYRNGASIMLRFFLVSKFEGEVDNRIFRDVRWVRRSDLPQYDFLDADLKLIKEIAEGKVI